MANSLDKYIASAGDWRKQIKTNTRRTYFVISLFIFIYFALGMLLDLYFYSGHYSNATLQQLFYALVTFQLFPIITIVMIGIAIISLFITFSFHDRLMLLGTEYHEVTPSSARDVSEAQLYNVIEEMKIAAGLAFMPRVFIIEADYMNAFASGYSEKSAMVAITRGLMQKLTRSELQAVMAHELSHIRHMDIKLTLMASVLANLTVIILDIFFYNIIFSSRRNSGNESRNSLATIIIIIRYLLPVINILLLLYLSRTREYMADAGSVELMRDNQPLATALLKISQDHTANQENYSHAYRQTPHENVRREAYIFDPVQAGIEPMNSLIDAFSTHPDIKSRLKALGFREKN